MPGRRLPTTCQVNPAARHSLGKRVSQDPLDSASRIFHQHWGLVKILPPSDNLIVPNHHCVTLVIYLLSGEEDKAQPPGLQASPSTAFYFETASLQWCPYEP